MALEKIYIFVNSGLAGDAIHFVRTESLRAAQKNNSIVVEASNGIIRSSHFLGEYEIAELQAVLGMHLHVCVPPPAPAMNYDQLAQLLIDHGYEVKKKEYNTP